MKKKLLFLPIIYVACLASCSENSNFHHFSNFEEVDKLESGYKDLGDYVIQLKTFTSLDYELEEKNYPTDVGALSCTTAQKVNKKGEVIIGRNLDCEVSQVPAYVIHTKIEGKYETIGIHYFDAALEENGELEAGNEKYTYAKFKEVGYKDNVFINHLGFTQTDSMNEKGLFIEANMRQGDRRFLNYKGTNPGKEKLSVSKLVGRVAQECATVQEALDFLRNKVDIHTLPFPNVPSLEFGSCTQFAYTIGDATGEFGIIEIAQDNIFYLPYAPAQANYYLSPELSSQGEPMAIGYGRYRAALNGLEKVETEEDMLEHMKKPMWSNYIKDYSKVQVDPTTGYPIFIDKETGREIMDFRSDYCMKFFVNNEGKYVSPSSEEFKGLTNEQRIEYLQNCNSYWITRDENYGELLKYFKETGKMEDDLRMLNDFYAGNETEIRNKCAVFTTGVSYGINCKQKRMLLRFWEREKAYEFKF